MKRILTLIDNVIEILNPVLLLIPRLYIGLLFIPAGWGKLSDLNGTIEFFKGLGVPFASVQAPIVATLELVLGVFILTGFMTRLSTIPLMGIMSVAILTAHKEEFEGFMSIINILPINYIIILLVVLIAGAGSLSLDKRLCDRCNS